MSGDRRWFVLIPLTVMVSGALAFAATWVGSDSIESDLRGRARSELASAGLPSATISFDGRDATVRGVTPQRAQQARDAVARVDGVRVVTVAQLSSDKTEPRADTRQRLTRQVAEALARNPITFEPNSDVLTPDGERAMAAVMTLLRDAPSDVHVEVAGHVAAVAGGNKEQARQLSQARAQTVAMRLARVGIPGERVEAIGYGDTRPVSGGDDPRLDRRVEITVR